MKGLIHNHKKLVAEEKVVVHFISEHMVLHFIRHQYAVIFYMSCQSDKFYP